MHRCLIITASILVLAATNTSTAWAGWGCGYRFANLAADRFGAVWGNPNEKAARSGVGLVQKKANVSGCYIVGCRDSIDTSDQAHVYWPLNGTAGVCVGNGCK
jgi:hypothetical protein